MFEDGEEYIWCHAWQCTAETKHGAPGLHPKIDDDETSHNAANFSFSGATPGDLPDACWRDGAVIRRDGR
jgi:hypothetical protein